VQIHVLRTAVVYHVIYQSHDSGRNRTRNNGHNPVMLLISFNSTCAPRKFHLEPLLVKLLEALSIAFNQSPDHENGGYKMAVRTEFWFSFLLSLGASNIENLMD